MERENLKKKKKKKTWMEINQILALIIVLLYLYNDHNPHDTHLPSLSSTREYFSPSAIWDPWFHHTARAGRDTRETDDENK